MSPRLGVFLAVLPLHLIVFNVLRAFIAREDGSRFSLVDILGWLDARSPGARRYRKLALGWLVLGAIGVVAIWTV